MRRRAIGQETEYGVGIPGYLDADMVARQVSLGDGRLPFHNLSGARTYGDVGSHPEYATPECDSDNIDELVAHVEAGHRTVARRAAAYDRVAAADRSETGPAPAQPICLYNSNTLAQTWQDFQLETATFGSHENYQVECDGSLSSFAAPLLPYLVTRQLLLGSGLLVPLRDGGLTYELAQRSRFMRTSISSSTTRDRPIINIRDESHMASGSGLKRLHLIVGDNCLTPRTTGSKFATMHGLLTLLEEGRLPELELIAPVRAIQAISKDPRRKVDFAGNQRPLSAREIQQAYFDSLWRLVDCDSEWDTLRPWVALWGRQLDKLQQSLSQVRQRLDWDTLAEPHLGELDWATKRMVLSKYRSTRPDAPDLKLQSLERSMHQVTGEHSVRQIILNRYSDYAERLPAILHAMENPPTTTRAAVRVWAWLHGHYAQNWNHIQTPLQKGVYLHDVWNTEIPRALRDLAPNTQSDTAPE